MKNYSYLIGALVADSLALAPHWIYDTNELNEKFGRLTELLEPEKGSYHYGQPLGGQTHLGHQTIVLSEALEKDIPFADHLRSFWRDSKSYKDHATKAFLAGQGGASRELAGASRLAAVVAHYPTFEEAAPVMREQTLVTHSAEVADAGEKLLRLFFALRDGKDTGDAVRSVFAGSSELARAESATKLEPVEAIAKLGQSCSLDAALPSLLYFLLRSEDYRESVIDNVMAGGDSAARGLLLGALLVAKYGYESIPEEWVKNLVYKAPSAS